MRHVYDGGLWAHRAWAERGSAAVYQGFHDYAIAANGSAFGAFAPAFAQAAAEETRHAALCGTLSSKLGALLPDGAPPTPRAPASDDDLLVNVAVMCCIGETLNAVLLGEELRVADSDVRDVIATLLRDEVRHARLGWQLVAEAAGGRDVACYGELLQAALDEALARPIESSSPSLSSQATLALRTAAIHDVVLPGFAWYGVRLTA